MADLSPTSAPSVALDCIVCGSRFEYVPKGGRLRRFCSDECKVARHRLQCASYRKPIRHNRTCARCGKAFVSIKPAALYCSPACKKSVKYKRKKERGWKRPPQHAYWSKRNARYRAAIIEPVDPFVVFERDGWRCKICGRKTDPGRRGTSDPLAPELDHIMPLSRGGEHSYRNTQCSCRRCNMAKGNRPMGQLVLL